MKQLMCRVSRVAVIAMVGLALNMVLHFTEGEQIIVTFTSMAVMVAPLIFIFSSEQNK